MCGIAGVISQKIKINESKTAVQKMNREQNRRGPDDEGIFADAKNGLVFGHRRLTILDLSKAGKQPMQWQTTRGNGQIVITYNGEIYNFLELKKDLENRGYEFQTKTDTEIILALYAEHEEKSFAMLRGMFAFALWDAEKQKLFLVKDRYGIKPLYYSGDNEKLVFASTVKAIAAGGLTTLRKNQAAFIGFLLLGSVPLPLTTYKDIHSVPAGHYLVRKANGRQKLIKYYEPLEFYRNKLTEQKEIAVLKTRQILQKSVNFHLISDAPLGVFLSGGLDSSVIAALSAEVLREGNFRKSDFRKLITLSVIFDEPEFSEQKYQRLVSQKIGSEHREIKIRAQDFYDSHDEIFEAMDQPTIDGVNTFFISQAAKKAGLKTMLSGLGADEIFLGYAHFRRAALIRNIQRLPKIMKLPLQFAAFFKNRYSKLNYLINNDILSFYLSARGLFNPQETAKILDIDLAEVHNFIRGFNDFLFNDIQSFLTELAPVDLLSYLELKLYLQNQLLKDADFMSMRHSVEIRVPFLDHGLTEYVSGLPAKIKLNQNFRIINAGKPNFIALNKSLLAAAVGKLLPPEIFTRPKMGFTFPFEKWLKEKNFLETGYHWFHHWAISVLENFQINAKIWETKKRF